MLPFLVSGSSHLASGKSAPLTLRICFQEANSWNFPLTKEIPLDTGICFQEGLLDHTILLRTVIQYRAIPKRLDILTTTKMSALQLPTRFLSGQPQFFGAPHRTCKCAITDTLVQANHPTHQYFFLSVTVVASRLPLQQFPVVRRRRVRRRRSLPSSHDQLCCLTPSPTLEWPLINSTSMVHGRQGQEHFRFLDLLCCKQLLPST